MKLPPKVEALLRGDATEVAVAVQRGGPTLLVPVIKPKRVPYTGWSKQPVANGRQAYYRGLPASCGNGPTPPGRLHGRVKTFGEFSVDEIAKILERGIPQKRKGTLR